MSAEAPPSRPRPTPPNATVVEYDEYIDKRIGQTRRTVWTVELASALVALVAGVLAFLFTAALIEHWLLPGGFGVVGRTLLFGALVGGAAYFGYRRIWPLLVRRINPVYAAQTIEQSSPSLKNSLINLLLFRQRRGELADAVYETLEEQAAQRLTRVPAEAAVDRTHLIRLGYVLVAVVVVAMLYRVVSPKDPLVTAERVLMPWADVVPASRVEITAVEPGTTTVTLGEYVDVSADVYGLRDDDTVVVRYTTDDGQAVDRAVPMASDDGVRFTCRLPGESEPGESLGVTQPLRYRIEAGDARSLDYQVHVVAAPTILVRSIDYDYPGYTGYADRSVDDLGDIRAIEGTRVTLHARANGPIDEAYIDFDADGRRDVRMTVDGNEAEASFTLALRPDRQTPEHTSYVLRFTNTDGRRNRQPVKHPIDVLPDYAPEVELTEPPERMRDVRLDETLSIGVDARDPDFALSGVRLQGYVGDRQVVDERLLATEHQGRFVTRYQFTPREHGLKVGDVVQYWAVAADSRTPQPNTATSERKVLRVTSPDPAKPQQQPDQPNQDQRGAGQPDQQPRDGQQGQPQEGQQGQQQDRQQGESQQGQPQQGDAQRDQGQAQGEQQQDDGAQNEGQRQNGPGAAGSAGEQAEPSAEGRQDQPQEGQSSPVADGERNQSSGQQERTGGDNNRSDVPSDAQPGEGRDGASPDAEPEPISSEGDNDAEAFDRIRRRMRETGDLRDDQESSADNVQPPSDRQGAQQQPDRDAREPFSRDSQRSADSDASTDRSAQTGNEDDQRQPNDAQRDAGDRPPGDSKDDRQTAEQGTERQPGDHRPSTEEPGAQPDQSPAPDGQHVGSEGPSGDGDQRDADQAPPGSRPETEQPDKWQQQPSGDQPPGDLNQPPAGRGERKPDSPGDQGSDRVGEGAERGPQETPHDGTGSTGQNQSADEGAGESAEQGAGNNSPDAGGDATANQRTGREGSEQPGEGSSQRDGTGHESSGGESETVTDGQQQSSDGQSQQPGGDTQQGPFSRDAQRSTDDAQRGADGGHDHGRLPGPSGESSGDQRAPGDNTQPNQNDQSPDQSGSQPSDAAGTPTGGGGQTGAGEAAPSSASGSTPDADDANLDYARRQTDLVLQKLADQLKRKQVDRELLDQLGWSEEDLQRFVARWQERMKAARPDTPAADPARRELDEALRSLGLRRGPSQQGDQPQDQLRDLGQGYRGAVPLEYRERLRAYSEGVSRSRQTSE